MPPTARKSSLHNFITRTCLSGDSVPDIIKRGQCVITDGTLKGHRTNIYAHRRSGISTDEIACVYKTEQSQEAVGIHFAIKQKLCTYLHCEADSAVTGIAPYFSSDYSFFIWPTVSSEPLLRFSNLKKAVLRNAFILPSRITRAATTQISLPMHPRRSLWTITTGWRVTL